MTETKNRKGTELNQPREFTRIHSTIHLFIQQKEIQKVARIKRIGLLQMSYSLVVILELNSISEVQYKEIIMIDNE